MSMQMIWGRAILYSRYSVGVTESQSDTLRVACFHVPRRGSRRVVVCDRNNSAGSSARTKPNSLQFPE
ncbi:MAG: hypothetical protein HC903_24725 [Methylacidiphilales bacterium]|nr:hypothetical protein [Candidatus Methylacidiphilales bacterium]